MSRFFHAAREMPIYHIPTFAKYVRSFICINSLAIALLEWHHADLNRANSEGDRLFGGDDNVVPPHL